MRSVFARRLGAALPLEVPGLASKPQQASSGWGWRPHCQASLLPLALALGLLVCSAHADPAGHVARVLFITDQDCPRCQQELIRLRRTGSDFDKMRARGWKIGDGAENHLQIVDRQAVPDVVRQLGVSEFPAVAFVNGDEVERSFRSGCTTPLDAWTFGWLATGIDLRPKGAVLEAARVETTGHYPLRGNHWTIDGDSNPSREALLVHLRGAVHGPQVPANYAIESWSNEELRSLHDNLHEQYGGGGSGGRSKSSSRSSNPFSASRKTTGR